MFNIINHCARRKRYGLTRPSNGSRIDEIKFASVGLSKNYVVLDVGRWVKLDTLRRHYVGGREGV